MIDKKKRLLSEAIYRTGTQLLIDTCNLQTGLETTLNSFSIVSSISKDPVTGYLTEFPWKHKPSSSKGRNSTSSFSPLKFFLFSL